MEPPEDINGKNKAADHKGGSFERRRWLFAAASLLGTSMSFYKASDVGNVSNIYARFFDSNLAEIDALVLVYLLGSSLSTLSVMILNGTGKLKTRGMCLLSFGTLSLTLTSPGVGITCRKNFIQISFYSQS